MSSPGAKGLIYRHYGVVIRSVIYLLHFGLHPVAVVDKLVEKYQSETFG